MADNINLDHINQLVTTTGEDFIKSDKYKKATTKAEANRELFGAMIKEAVRNLLLKQDADKEQLREEITQEVKQDFYKKIEKKDEEISELRNENRELRFQIDSSKQYQLRENIKISGVEVTEGEDCKEIAKHIAEHTMGLTLEDDQISAAYRVNTRFDPESATERTNSGRPARIPQIVVRYTSRNIKAAQLKAKKHIKHKQGCMYPNAEMYEDVTPLRSRIMYALRKKLDSQGQRKYKYVWSTDGKIFIRTEAEANMENVPRAKSVQRPEDLEKFGWTKEEIEKIIHNIRD